ncbi:hypothetical protein RV134_350582 [Roseovarius sp. EC-HK134]|nr:hypothetical protein RV420_410152 [Roseovarius sp. EC-SD190]VVT30987.1 hypothetical protein RV134_350582 [Roseovarius sp. EC-HK134]
MPRPTHAGGDEPVQPVLKVYTLISHNQYYVINVDHENRVTAYNARRKTLKTNILHLTLDVRLLAATVIRIHITLQMRAVRPRRPRLGTDSRFKRRLQEFYHDRTSLSERTQS